MLPADYSEAAAIEAAIAASNREAARRQNGAARRGGLRGGAPGPDLPEGYSEQEAIAEALAASEAEAQGGGGHYDKSAIGKKVEVYWDGDGEWFAGTVKDYKPETRKHLIKYEDNDTGWIVLAKEEELGQLRWLDGRPPKAKAAPAKPPAKKAKASVD